MPGVPAVLGGVAVRLAVLDAQSHGEGLGLHGHAPAVEHFKGVPGGVPGAEDQAPAGTRFPPRRAGKPDAREGSVFHPQVLQPGLEANVRPQGGQLPAEVLKDFIQVIRAHVGLGVHEDVRGRSAGDQPLQDEAVAGVLGSGVQLPIGEGPGPALAELDVAGQVQLPRGPEAFHVGPAGFHGAAPLQKDGPLARLRQHKGGEEPRRSRSHYHRRLFRRGQGFRQAVGRARLPAADLPAPAAAEDGGLVLRKNRQRIGQGHVFPGVHAAPEDPEVPEIRRAEAQQLCGLGPEVCLAAAGGEADAFKFDHGSAPFVGMGILL